MTLLRFPLRKDERDQSSHPNRVRIKLHNVKESSKHIATSREPPPEGGVHDLIFNAVLTDNSMFHNDTAT